VKLLLLSLFEEEEETHEREELDALLPKRATSIENATTQMVSIRTCKNCQRRRTLADDHLRLISGGGS